MARERKKVSFQCRNYLLVFKKFSGFTFVRCIRYVKFDIDDYFKEVKDMAVKIRLRRMGKKKAPFYRVVVADSRSPRDGKFIEEIGTYDPNQDPSVFKFDEESAKKWLANGAKPTETVGKLLKEAGIME